MSLLAALGQDLVFIGFYFLPFALYLAKSLWKAYAVSRAKRSIKRIN